MGQVGILDLHWESGVLASLKDELVGDEMATERNNEIRSPHDVPEILTVREVAAFLRCSKAHVCNAIHGRVQGVSPLPAISMGRRKLVSRQSLLEWLMKNDPARCGSVL